MSYPSSRFDPGRPRRARAARQVRPGTGVVLDCTACGLSIETIEIGTAGPDLVPETFRCALCLVGAETYSPPEPDPDVQVGPPEALRVLRRRLDVAPEPTLDLLALLGGPEAGPREKDSSTGERSMDAASLVRPSSFPGTPEEAAEAAPLSLVPSPVLPEAADDEHSEPDDSFHDDGFDAFRRR